ncbi:MAG TPA: VWA domain-containing protein, partial [Polyangiaceae bacterium]
MPRPDAMTRVVDELLWLVRREGVEISTVQAIDALRAANVVGFEDRTIFRDAIASVVTSSAIDRRRFDRAFDAFFSARTNEGDLFDRLRNKGFSESERDAVRDLLDEITSTSIDGDSLAPLLQRGAELERLLRTAGIARTFDSMQSPLQAGFYAHRALDRVGLSTARSAMASLRAKLREAFGDRGDLLADALEAELAAAADDVRTHVQRSFAKRDEARTMRGGGVEAKAFVSLSDQEIVEVRRAVRNFALRLRGGERVRKKHALRGRLDPRATLRRALATGGVPITAIRKTKRRERARIVLLCDVSDSVRAAARFMLEFVYFAHELFDQTRSFVFVSELGETTDLFATEPIERALVEAYGGGIVPVQSNSNYGRVFRQFEERHAGTLDRRTTLVILGDGRTNYHADAADALGRLKDRARSVYWLCSEPRAAWASGDSAMQKYSKNVTKVLEVTCARELEDAARLLTLAR